ncbi:hypothetical protein SAMN05443247_06588 [Bradyrhizobium erythrophlei]|nr:hypothetical protein SAMN05443247_06588 [Bradyrhizobium erythrophlei]
MGQCALPNAGNHSTAKCFGYTTATMSLILTLPVPRGRWGHREPPWAKVCATKGEETLCGVSSRPCLLPRTLTSLT